ncbi:ferredoxin--NADP reductase [Rhizorhabdus dicambivorans]|uniref:3-ketosteroid-9-alpha-hydroxylase n=1 Tax=Rhizorhabdus dicambivorans TaxID=1850238 RepID=A0A2A4FZV1_9SPHN|nr:ferredoxin--NADP reductase [Rhizorhabdus dicambivorans]ATE65853.1 3-ketosteroid-9-alpha-hydroxylase [Rhizorhabdus dicambivorans]PCE42967.1 3-ketosteroid-9-alpha-hydroxylase [Rhizorhabdus dicambivorans]
MSDNYHALEVVDVVEEIDDARTFVLAVPPDKADQFGYRSGQFLTVRLATEEGQLERCYSLSSVPGVDEHLRITVKRVPFGPVSNWMIDRVRTGDRLAVMRPAGVFVARDATRDLSLFAAGSGITPIISLAKDRLRQPAGKVALFYANRDERSVIFKAELNQLAADYPDRFSVTHWLETVQGLPTPKLLAAHAAHLAGREHFICGPAPYMDAVAAALDHLGVDRHQVHLERFVFAAPQPVTSVPSRDQPAAEASRLELTLDGRTATIDWAGGTLMLDAMQEAGFSPPYSCRSGSCGACICQLDAGEVDMQQNQVLDARDLAEGLILACQAIARSPAVKVTF